MRHDRHASWIHQRAGRLRNTLKSPRASSTLVNCFECDGPAIAICKFCGNAVCHEHRSTGRYVTGWRAWGAGTFRDFGSNRADLVEVLDATWCGRCTVQHHEE